MYGDVFGNRDPEVYGQEPNASGSRTPTDTHTPTHVHRWQPVFEQERTSARYGYDPWTKTAFNLSSVRTRWWCWQLDNPVWHAALHYTIGSLLFVIASFAAMFVTVRETPSLKRWLYAYPYMVGSINYTTGASILLYKSWTNHPSKMADPEESVAPSYSGYLPVQVDGPVGYSRYTSPYQDREGHTNPPSVYESTYETSTYENVSRPPSFHSVRWWPGGEPDRENSAASMSASLQPTTIAGQRSSSTLTPGPVAEEPDGASRPDRSFLDPEDSQESVTVPLLGKGESSGYSTAPSQDPLLPQTVLPPPPAAPPRHTFQPYLRIKTTPRTTPRVSSRSSVSANAQSATDAANAANAAGSGNNLEAFGSRALEAVPQQSDGEQERAGVTQEPSDATVEHSAEKQDTITPHSSGVAVAKTFTFSPGEFSGLDGQKVSEADDDKSSNTRDTSLLGSSSVGMSGDAGSPRSPDQYPATPRSPRSPRDDEPGKEHEQGVDDDRSTMISQPTDTQSMTSYYRVFGNRWTAATTAEQQTDQEHILTVQSRHPDQLNSLLRNYYRRDAFYYIRADPWYKRRWLLDLSGSATIFAGTILYNVSCTSLCYEAVVGEQPPLFSNKVLNNDVLAYYPSTVGGLFFIVGSWLFWWAAHKTPLLWGSWVRIYTMEFWVTFLNLVGSVGFFYGAVTGVSIGAIQGLVPNWFELMIGYVIGSVLFMVGSYLMVAELASHAADNAVLSL